MFFENSCPFGMLMPGRSYSVANTDYRYGFNGKENDNDIENGTYDFSSRILDTRLGGRWLSMDPQQRKYPNESNYIFTSDNPIIYADGDGKDKIYTLTVIDKDGHKVVTHHTDAWFGIYSVSEHAGIFNPNHYFESDLNVNLTIDLRSKTATYYQYESNFRQISAGDYAIDKTYEKLKNIGERFVNSFNSNDNERGSQKWGTPFTSEYSHTADGPKTDPTEGSDRSVNIDGIMAAAGAVKMTPEALKFTMADAPEWAELLHKDAEALVKENPGSSPTNSPSNTKQGNIDNDKKQSKSVTIKFTNKDTMINMYSYPGGSSEGNYDDDSSAKRNAQAAWDEYNSVHKTHKKTTVKKMKYKTPAR